MKSGRDRALAAIDLLCARFLSAHGFSTYGYKKGDTRRINEAMRSRRCRLVLNYAQVNDGLVVWYSLVSDTGYQYNSDVLFLEE